MCGQTNIKNSKKQATKAFVQRRMEQNKEKSNIHPEYQEKVKDFPSAYDSECPFCQGIGRRRVEVEGKIYSRPCECLKEVIFQRKCKHSQIPEHLWENEGKITKRVKAIATIKGKEKEININKFIKQYTDNLEKMLEQKKNIIFMGNNGSGKTLSSCLIAMDALRQGFSAHYTSSKNLLSICGSIFSNDESKKMFSKMKEVDFLILDEYGKEYHSEKGWTYAELEDFLNYRFTKNKVTIIITNFENIMEVSDGDIKMEKHQESIISRFLGMTLRIKVLIDNDYRLKLAEEMWEDFDVENLQKEDKQ
ncbi:MAG: ATP-binding protein [bacterium]